ncbi:hypothetical protein KQI86_03890 [Clostridium sp. MSJ-11]|uniref:Uncharacterized protein n=1 Tax=Clostridium mobile TaxID=2841512 RepID=A0ABS6EFA7_9CLOT|nr:hypothetical protein [Clostridium mobile]MBU5483457.1 hypothetical protein [Clostridium mobile]
MANINIDVGTGTLLVYKGEDFSFPFTIYPPVETSEDIITSTNELVFNREIIGQKQFTMTHTKAEWIRLDSFEYVLDDDIGRVIKTTGITKARFKYRIELVGVSGEILQVVKDYQKYFMMINEPISDEVIVPISLITTAVNSYKVRVVALFENGNTSSASREVVLYNEAPTIVGTVEKNVLYLNIGDTDNDLVRFNVYLNNRKVYPVDSDYTGFEPPGSHVVKFESVDVIINDVNTIVINAQDNYGTRNKFEYPFLGEYSGILFSDENGEYYSTDLGDILKRLKFGTVMAGSMSDIAKVIITNNMGFDVKNLEVIITPEKKPDKLDVYYGFESGMLIKDNEQLLRPGTMPNKGTQDLYLRIHPDIEFEHGSARFEIFAQAQPAE